MQVHEQQYGAITVVKPDGPLAGTDADKLKARLLEVLKENLGRMVLDASKVPFVDSKGLEGLVDVTNELAHGGLLLKVCGLNETIRQVFELTGLSSQFEHFEDTNSAVRSFL